MNIFILTSFLPISDDFLWLDSQNWNTGIKGISVSRTTNTYFQIACLKGCVTLHFHQQQRRAVVSQHFLQNPTLDQTLESNTRQEIILSNKRSENCSMTLKRGTDHFQTHLQSQNQQVAEQGFQLKTLSSRGWGPDHHPKVLSHSFILCNGCQRSGILLGNFT